jgi:hypothetical protein
MRYLRVRWLHSHPDDPVELYSEIDTAGFEQRKVEIFRDGRIGFASATEKSPNTDTRLGESPIPATEQIALDSEFQPTPITRDEFENIWARRLTARVSA